MNAPGARLPLTSLIVAAVVFLCSCSDNVSVKTAPKNIVTLVSQDTVLTFGVAPIDKKIKAQPEKRYFYFIRNAVSSTQGGYLGRPLNGNYLQSTVDNVMIERGNFSNGLKDGEWTSWFPNGQVRQRVTWKDGERSGKFYSYSPDGQVIERGTYKNDKLSSSRKMKSRLRLPSLRKKNKTKADTVRAENNRATMAPVEQSSPSANEPMTQPNSKKGKSLTRKNSNKGQ